MSETQTLLNHSENLPLPPNAELEVPAPDHIKLYQELISDEGKSKLERALQDELETSDMQHIGRLFGRANQLNTDAKQAGDISEQQKINNQINRIYRDTERTFGRKAMDKYQAAKNSLNELKEDGSVRLFGEGAQHIADTILSPDNLFHPEGEPFIPEMTELSFSPYVTAVMDPSDTQLQIPLDSIVSAAGFESWEGRGNQSSRQKIIDYASRETDIPPIQDQLFAFILPNGKVVFESANAHRVAAAKMKGQKSIGFNGTLHVTKLDFMPDGLSEKSVESHSDTESHTKNGHEIEHPREVMSAQEFKQMVAEYGLNQDTPEARVEALKSMSKESIAYFLSDINRRLQGSDDTLISDETEIIGGKDAINIEDRYDLFNTFIDKIKASKDVNPARIGDAIGLGTVILHPFKDGNGRTSRMMSLLFRDEYDQDDYEDDFKALAESRDDTRARGGYGVYGFIPYFPEDAEQNDPIAAEAYIDSLLNENDKTRLYSGPFGQAPLNKK